MYNAVKPLRVLDWNVRGSSFMIWAEYAWILAEKDSVRCML